MKKQFLLGADDPEMKAMEHVLREKNVSFTYASVKGGRTTPGNSYRADPIDVPDDRQLVVVECAFEGMSDSVIVIDHHRPGDPGFALGPDKFWEAASIGQMHRLLGLKPDHAVMVIAAFDHCFAAAVRGECHGIHREEVIRLRVSEISKQTGASGVEVWQLVAAFRHMLTHAPKLVIGDQTVNDFRREYLGEGYSLKYLAAQLAATMNGDAVLLRHRDHVREVEKNTLTGHAFAATVKAFMKSWAPAQGLERIYGVPERGYGGGYVARRHSLRTA